MLSADERSRFTVVLVGARNPSNIGAAARAMQDFGFSDLRIVNDYAAPFEAAQLEASQLESSSGVIPKSAVAAAGVMQQARRFDHLAEAIADCTLVAGTTAIGERDMNRTVLSLQQTAPRLLHALQTPGSSRLATRDVVATDTTGDLPTPPQVALLFGSEKTGLTNEQLSHCSLLTTIPMFEPGSIPNSTSAATGKSASNSKAPRHLSMNLGQSVAVCLYELTREGFEGSKELPVIHRTPATADDRERLTQLLLDVMHVTGYIRRFPANSSEPQIRQLTQQLGVTHRESMTWMGILRQILWRERNQ
jgi:tRNA C32,U32 (ribose-2'-O)-methylase TrmJ